MQMAVSVGIRVAGSRGADAEANFGAVRKLHIGSMRLLRHFGIVRTF